MEMSLGDIGRLLVGLAVVLAVLGGVLMLAGRAGLGRLPGDISFGGDGLRVYIPLATCLLVSLVATIVLNLVIRR
jgi:hypothetical protein